MINKKSKLFGLFALALVGTLSFASCSSDDNNDSYDYKSPSSVVLSSHNWVTTSVLDQDSLNVDLNNSVANVYVGYAYYKKEGDFRIVALNDNNKMYGQWMLINNDKSRRLNVYNSFNEVSYTRDTEILTLNDSVFTYRIHYNNADKSKYFDVKHVPTNHKEPLTPAQVLASTQWVTTNIYDITSFYRGAVGSTANNNPITPDSLANNAINAAIENGLPKLDTSVAPASNYFGDATYGNPNGGAYFPMNADKQYVNGTFVITVKDEPTNVRSKGNWYTSLDGKYRTLYALNDKNEQIWSRVVSIHELTANKFTYDIVDGSQVLRVEHQPK